MKKHLVKAGLAAVLGLSGILTLNVATADQVMVDPISGDQVSQEHQLNIAAPTDGNPQANLPAGGYAVRSEMNSPVVDDSGVGVGSSAMLQGEGTISGTGASLSNKLDVNDTTTPGSPFFSVGGD